MIFTDAKLTPTETATVGRGVELSLRGQDLTDVAIRDVLENAARQSSDTLWKRAANGSAAQFRRIVAATIAARATFLAH